MKPFLTACLLTLSACAAPADSGPARLLFASGFEGDVRFGPRDIGDSYYEPIIGTDSETGFQWPITVLGASESALHMIDHDNYTALKNAIQTVIGHDGRQTRALYSAESHDTGVTQAPYEILNITQGRSDLYLRYWMKLDGKSLHALDTWRALFEYKTKGYATGDGFRLISYVYTDEEGNPYWHWQGDAFPAQAVWEIDNFDIPVPEDEWFLTEYYWHWSGGKDGRALWRVNGEVVGDHRGPTTLNSQPIDFIMLSQIYGDANPKHQWIDDIEIWSGLPEKYFGE